MSSFLSYIKSNNYRLCTRLRGSWKNHAFNSKKKQKRCIFQQMSPQNSVFIHFHNLCVAKLPYTKLKSESILVLTLLSMACIDIYNRTGGPVWGRASNNEERNCSSCQTNYDSYTSTSFATRIASKNSFSQNPSRDFCVLLTRMDEVK